MINTDKHAPVIGPTLAYDVDLSPTLRGIIVKAPGGLLVKDINDKTALFTFAAQPAVVSGDSAAANVTSFPYRLDLQIRRIVGNGSGSAGDGTTGTNIALADLIPLA